MVQLWETEADTATTLVWLAALAACGPPTIKPQSSEAPTNTGLGVLRTMRDFPSVRFLGS
jgi:hypothetical protein